MTLVRRDDRHKKVREKKIVLKATSKREEKAPRTIDFEWLVKNCKLRRKFLKDAIKAVEKEYPSIDFYQEFDWWQEGCPRIREEGDREAEFWDYLSEKGYAAKGEMQAKQELDMMERQKMEHEVVTELNKPCGAVKLLQLIYKKDPKKQWVTRQDKDWLKNLLLGKEGISKVYDVLDNRCGNGPKKELARIYLRDSFGLSEEKNIERLTKNKETVIIRSEKGWITHINKMPLRVRIRSSDLADTGFFDKYDVADWHPDLKGTTATYKKIPKEGRTKREKKRKFELDEEPESFIVRPKTMRITPHTKEEKQMVEKIMMAKGEKELPKPPERSKRLKGQKGEFLASGGGQRTLFGSPPPEKELEDIVRRLRRKR